MEDDRTNEMLKRRYGRRTAIVTMPRPGDVIMILTEFLALQLEEAGFLVPTGRVRVRAPRPRPGPGRAKPIRKAASKSSDPRPQMTSRLSGKTPKFPDSSVVVHCQCRTTYRTWESGPGPGPGPFAENREPDPDSRPTPVCIGAPALAPWMGLWFWKALAPGLYY
jgi:hypothetical protein